LAVPLANDVVHGLLNQRVAVLAGGEAVMRTRKGLDWTSDFAAIAEAARSLDDCIIDGEVVALDHNGAPEPPGELDFGDQLRLDPGDVLGSARRTFAGEWGAKLAASSRSRMMRPSLRCSSGVK
jgi:hypothetical protein